MATATATAAGAAELQAAYAEQRAGQKIIAAGFLAQFVSVWPSLKFDSLDDSFPDWSKKVLAIIRPWRQKSADLGLKHYRDIRFMAVPDAPKLIVPVMDWSQFDRVAETGLQITGPVNIKQAMTDGLDEEQAMERALTDSSGSAARSVLEGGRTIVPATVQSDPVAVGWQRVTDSDPCYRCALYASRGPVYKSQQSASFFAHDNDQCSCSPVFDKNAPWAGDAQDYRDLYRKSTRGLSGPAAVKAFRAAWESRNS